MKKITALIIAVSAMLSNIISVSAESENVVYKFSMQEPFETKAAFALFSKGALTYCGLYNIEKNSGGEYYITVSENDAKKGDEAKIVLFESGKILKNIIPEKSDTSLPEESESPSPSPEITTEPESTQAPESSPENTPQASPAATLNPVYPKEIDAVSAFAVVKKVSKTYIDDEIVYDVTVFYQGAERLLHIKTDTYITSSPDGGPSVTGDDVSALREGDVISISSSVSGKIKGIVLVMRPPSKDPLVSGDDYGESFERLYSRNGIPSAYAGDDIVIYNNVSNARVKYAFGVITDKTSSSLTLCGTDGKENNSFYADIDKNTCVYGIDADDSNETSIENISYIRKSSIPKIYFDDDGNINEWNSECEYTYALVRIVDDTATDIAVITY